MSQSKPILHHMNNSQSQRIPWLLEELDIKYTLINHFRQPSQEAPPELKEIHPLGKAPLLETGDGVAISESSAIATYLLLKYDTACKFSTDRNDVSKITKEEALVSFAGTTMGTIIFLDIAAEAITKRTPWPLSYLPRLMQGGGEVK